jgi:t-SNARE complex subunit (syntaxin)
MGKVIYCDFRRTERRKEIVEIEKTMQNMVDAFENHPDEIEDTDYINVTDKLVKKYYALLREEEEWGKYELYK